MSWAGRVFEAAARGTGPAPGVAAAVELARDRWSRGREEFELIRGGLAAAGERLTHEQRVLSRLAELVAKVAHNVAGPPPYFDHHAGWQMGLLAWRLATATDDPAVRARIAGALGGTPPA
ncbi:hypothetical protein [Streptomyces sp. NPDC020996]|uniref:hypothetical protein n=1 Tax=Streptomyces sp. NPDC020996 TaxID=3154791 RepID=UPI0033FE64CB